MNFQRENQLLFELLKGVKVEDKVEGEGENGTIKQVLQEVEVNQRRIFVGIKQGVGKHEIFLLFMINEDRADVGSKWIREKYGEILNIFKS